MSTGPNRHEIQGSVAPGFESVRELYARELETMEERETQLCVYHRGERVVDLWASKAESTEGAPGFSADSLVNVFSSGKSLAAIAMGWLVGQGRLDYGKRVADYWPEFADNGKQDLTVADILRHEGGMAAFDRSIDPADLLTENLKHNRVGEVIEAQTARFPGPDGRRREYHAITRGWILNEIFRRVDERGRTMGEFYREEIAGPLEADVHIGVPEADLDRIEPVKVLGFGFHLLQSLKPRFLGRRIKHHFFQILGRLLKILFRARHATTRGAPPPLVGWKGVGIVNRRDVAMGESPSAMTNCSARGLARVAAMMAARGKWKGREYLGEAGWRAMHAAPTEADMGFAPTIFTQGGVNEFRAVAVGGDSIARAFNEGREGFYGWMGLGGSIFQWHPEHQIGFAFVPTALHVVDILNERGKVYQAEVLRCVERLAEA